VIPDSSIAIPESTFMHQSGNPPALGSKRAKNRSSGGALDWNDLENVCRRAAEQHRRKHSHKLWTQVHRKRTLQWRRSAMALREEDVFTSSSRRIGVTAGL
jgi:hypothetical protein